MGSFSWLKADTLTHVANIVTDAPFKFLIPKEFGGGFIVDNYQDYGYLGRKEDGSPRYDMYELLAFWNSDVIFMGEYVIDSLRYDGNFNPMKEIDEYSDKNRHAGIHIGCYDKDIDKLKYPLKLVSIEYDGTYEDCPGRSYGDPNQGWNPLYRAPNRHSSCGEPYVQDTADYIARRIIDKFEDLLDEHGINIPDGDRTGSEGEAPIYGCTYADLIEEICEILYDYIDE